MSNIISCTRKIEFDAAHRVVGHGSKCRFLHGHRYCLEANFISPKLDRLGMVVDFGDIKKILGKWINDNFDHNVILSQEDKELGDYISKTLGQNVFYLNSNPTAENIAQYILEFPCRDLFKDSTLICNHVRLYETPNCYVDVFNKDNLEF